MEHVGRPKAAITLDASKCNLCRLCINLCPTYVYEEVNNKMVIHNENCICCKACEVLCPQKAIKVIISDEGLYIKRYSGLSSSCEDPKR